MAPSSSNKGNFTDIVIQLIQAMPLLSQKTTRIRCFWCGALCWIICKSTMLSWGERQPCLLAQDPTRSTEDVDLVIHVDQRMITADRLTSQLLTSYPSDIVPIDQYGHIIPGFKLSITGGGFDVVHLEIFDHQSWPRRPQYNIETASRKTITVNGRTVKTFSPEWILREKILSQHEKDNHLSTDER